MLKYLFLPAFLMLCISPLYANAVKVLYKCVHQGHISYQENPCKEGNKRGFATGGEEHHLNTYHATAGFLGSTEQQNEKLCAAKDLKQDEKLHKLSVEAQITILEGIINNTKNVNLDSIMYYEKKYMRPKS